MRHDDPVPPPAATGGAPITFDRARKLAANSPEVLQWFDDASGIDVTPWGWENSTDYILGARQRGEPWWHDAEVRLIPGPPMIVVSKATGEVCTFVGASVPMYYDEREIDEDESPIGDVPDGLS